MKFYSDDIFIFPDEIKLLQQIKENGWINYFNNLRYEDNSIWRTWFQATRTGDTSVGHTLEYLMGIIENNNSIADHYGIEVKASCSDSAHITLWCDNPEFPFRANHHLVDALGTIGSDNIKRLNTNLACDRITVIQGHEVTLQLNDLQLAVTVDGKVAAGWSIERLRQKSMKIASLLLAKAEKREDNTDMWFKYDDYSLFEDFNFSDFIRLIREKKISVHFRVKGSLDKCRNRGTAFRIAKQDMAKLYRHCLPGLVAMLDPASQSDMIFVAL